jgi:hypothetical protein
MEGLEIQFEGRLWEIQNYKRNLASLWKIRCLFSTDSPSAFEISKGGPFEELLNSIFRKPRKPPLGQIHPALASYEFYFQKAKKKDQDSADTLNYEFGFKNITDSPLLNFAFTARFREPVISVGYDFSRSSANMTGGKGLSEDKRSFNWRGNQIMENGGWVVFNVKSKKVPIITKISTRLVGRMAGENRVIPPDPDGI